MSIIQVEQQKDQLVVDSRLIADNLGIEHKVFVRNIQNHQETIESAFGRLMFENHTVEQPNGGTREYFSHYLLNEDQATFSMTLSRNTPQVIECKVNLVKAFSEARKELEKNKVEGLTPCEITLRHAQHLVNLERQQKALEKQQAIEAQRTDKLQEVVNQHDVELNRVFAPDGNMYSIRGFAKLIDYKIGIQEANKLGRIASKASDNKGYPKDKLPDPRYGKVNAYHEDILKEIFEEHTDVETIDVA